MLFVFVIDMLDFTKIYNIKTVQKVTHTHTHARTHVRTHTHTHSNNTDQVIPTKIHFSDNASLSRHCTVYKVQSQSHFFSVVSATDAMLLSIARSCSSLLFTRALRQ